MAKAFDDAALWLPPKLKAQNAVPDAVLGFPSEFPYDFGVTSPVESVAGSTETESSDEEEDFFAGLTRRLSQTTLQDSRKHQLTPSVTGTDKYEVHKTRVLARSPQSTLSGIGSWSCRSAVLGDETSNGSSHVPSPLMAPFSDQNDPWEEIYTAAGQVARLKINGNVSPFDLLSNRGLPDLSRAIPKNPTPVPNSISNLTSPMRQDQVMKQMCAAVLGRQDVNANWVVQHQKMQNRGREVGYESVKCGNRHLHLPQSAWPPPQPQHQNQQKWQFSGSGSRVSGPGGSAPPKRACGGTGVFLPRQYGNQNHPSEPRKKTGCAQVVVPAKVVHALNLNFEDLNANFQLRSSNTFATDYDAMLARRNALLLQQRFARRVEAASYEVRLPQEWTY